MCTVLLPPGDNPIAVNKYNHIVYIYMWFGVRSGVLVKALCYKPAGHGFDSQWCHWNFSVT